MPPTFALRSPLLWILIPFMLGLSAAHVQPPATETMLLFLTVAAILPAVAIARQELTWCIAVSLAAALTGWIWLPLRSPPAPAWDDPPREVEVVVEIEQLFATSQARTTSGGLAKIVGGGASSSDLVGQRIYYSVIRRFSVPAVASGQYLLRGVARKLPPDPGGAGFEAYLANVGVHFEIARGQFLEEAKPPTSFHDFCQRSQEHFARILSAGVADHPNAVSLYLGMLLGQKAEMSAAQEAAFMQTGVFHIFSISGLHVGVIAIAIQGALQFLRVPRRVAVTAGVPVLWLYVQISGGSTPAERAFLMIAFMSSAKVLRLPANPLAALSGAALVTLIGDPRQLFTAGFQLSYGVVAALIVMGMPLGARCVAWWQPWKSLPEADWKLFHRAVHVGGARLLSALAVSGVAMLASIPSGIGYFELVTPGSIIANLVVIPISGVAIIAGLLSLWFGLCGLLAGSVFLNHAAMLAIYVMEAVVRQGATLPGMYFAARFEQPWIATTSAALVLGTMFAGAAFRWKNRAGGFWAPVVMVALILLLAVEYPG